MEDPEIGSVRPDPAAKGSVDQRVAAWVVSVPLPEGAEDAPIERTMEELAYLDARIEDRDGHRFIIMRVQAASHVDAVCYGVQRVLAMLDGPTTT